LIISNLIRNTIRYTSVTSVTSLLFNDLRASQLEARNQKLETRPHVYVARALNNFPIRRRRGDESQAVLSSNEPQEYPTETDEFRAVVGRVTPCAPSHLGPRLAQISDAIRNSVADVTRRTIQERGRVSGERRRLALYPTSSDGTRPVGPTLLRRPDLGPRLVPTRITLAKIKKYFHKRNQA
jgi:hypothetical protein